MAREFDRPSSVSIKGIPRAGRSPSPCSAGHAAMSDERNKSMYEQNSWTTLAMDDFSWIHNDVPNSQHPYKNEDSTNKHRLLIMRAASSDDYETLESVMASLPPSDTPLIHSAMCRAASRGHLRSLKTLARYSRDIHADDTKRATNTVISAVVGGHCHILDFILANGGNIDRPTQSGRTALTTAISLGQWDLLSLVLSRGAVVSKSTAEGRTALCLAAATGRYDIVEVLLQHGASVNCGCHCFSPGRFDRFHSALDVAALKGYHDTVALLLNYGALCFRESELFLPMLESVLSRGDEVLARTLVATGPNLDCRLETRNITPLCLAVQRGSISTVKFFSLCGASVHVSSQDGPPLCYAILKNQPTIASWLLRSGADANAHSETYGCAIHAAVEFGFVGLVDLLLRSGAEVYVDSPKGYPLHIARQEWKQSFTSERQRRFEGIIDLLRNAGASDDESRAASTGIYDSDSAYDSGDKEDMNGRGETWFDWT